MKNGENMQFKDNIDCEKSYHEKIIRICDRHPKDEEMLLVKAKSLKSLKKTYKFLECMDEILKINPYSITALVEMAKYLGDENV